ncbi:MAG: flagellar motor switch protein FliG [Spirochaetia bacterium]
MARRKWGADAYKNMQGRENKSEPPVSVRKTEKKLEGFLKAGPQDKQGKIRKAAKFLLILGSDEAANVLKHLEQSEVEGVIRELTRIGGVSKEERQKLFEEFGNGFRKTGPVKPVHGKDAAKSILIRAFGTGKAEEILGKAVPKSGFFDFLKELDGIQTAQLLKDESSLVQAVVLPYLDPESASKTLERLHSRERLEVVRRIARMKKIDSQIVDKIADALREKAHRIGKTASEDVDGKGVLAGILKYLDPEVGEDIIGALKKEAPEVAGDIEDRLFTMDTILLLRGTDLQRVIRKMEDKEIALLLKGKSEEIRAKILGNVSDRRRVLITEEYKILGPMPKREVNEAARDFIRLLRSMEEDGEIVIPRHNEEIIE